MIAFKEEERGLWYRVDGDREGAGVLGIEKMAPTRGVGVGGAWYRLDGDNEGEGLVLHVGRWAQRQGAGVCGIGKMVATWRGWYFVSFISGSFLTDTLGIVTIWEGEGAHGIG